MVNTPSPILERTHKAYAYLRSATFSGEFFLLTNFTKLFKSYGELPLVSRDPRLKPFLLNDIKELFENDARLFGLGICPWSLLLPEPPLRHFGRLGKIMLAGVEMSRLRKLRHTKLSGDEIPADVPPYYRRNYHWQVGGYLNEASAALYDHQVEILFKGTAAAMRRLMMRPLHAFLQSQTAPARILEVGAGTGLAAQEVHVSFPEHHLTVSDLSGPYLAEARARMKHATNVDFVRASAAELPFKDQQFDVVYSCFMFHEMPRDVREASLKEFRRVLRSGGLLVIVDSIQQGDVPEYQAVLEKFPEDYHEPFYQDYSRWPLTEALACAGFSHPQTERGFFSKCVSAVKS